MGSLLRTAKKHKKSRRLGAPEVMAREEYGELEVDVKIEMIRSRNCLPLWVDQGDGGVVGSTKD